MKEPKKDTYFPTQRMEALSDGVIAIIITLMILEVKAPEVENDSLSNISDFIHHIVAFGMSFLMLGIYWVNHHNFFHKIKQGTPKLLWLNLNLLFWMSLIPIPTGFLGSHYELPIASIFYGVVLFMNSFSFTYMGQYAGKHGLFSEKIPVAIQQRNKKRNRLALGLYVLAMVLAFVSVYLSFAIFIFVAAMYFMPKLGMETKKETMNIPEVLAEDMMLVETKIEEAVESIIKTKKIKIVDENPGDAVPTDVVEAPSDSAPVADEPAADGGNQPLPE